MLVYAIICIVSSSLGLLVGAMISASKVSYLYERVELAERELQVQTAVIAEITSAIKAMLDSIEDRISNSVGEDSINRVRGALSKYDNLASREIVKSGG